MFFCLSSLTIVILVSHGIAQKECEIFICSTWNILFGVTGGLLKFLYENRGKERHLQLLDWGIARSNRIMKFGVKT